MSNLYVREALPKLPYLTAEQKLESQGLEAMLDGELLSLVVGLKDEDIKALMESHQIQELVDLPLSELRKLTGIKSARILKASLELARRVLNKGLGVVPVISCPADTLPFLQDIKDKDREYFKVLFANVRTQVIHSEIISVGSLSASIVHPRELFKAAIQHSTSSVLLAHNHPSGDPSPSKDDVELTRRLANAGEILGIEILDHIIICSNDFLSIKERGLM